MGVFFLVANSLYAPILRRPAHDNSQQLAGYAMFLKRREPNFELSRQYVDLVGVGRSKPLHLRRERVSEQQYSLDRAVVDCWMQKLQEEIDFAQQQKLKRIRRYWFIKGAFLFEMKNPASLISWIPILKQPRKEYQVFTFSYASQCFYARKNCEPGHPGRNGEPSSEEADEIRFEEGVMARVVIKMEEKRGKKPVILQVPPCFDPEASESDSDSEDSESDLDSDINFEE